MASNTTAILYVGGYTQKLGHVKADVVGQGIYSLRFDVNTGQLTAEKSGSPAVTAVNPSYICQHSQTDVLYATCETDEGQIRAFAMDGKGGLKALDSIDSGGGAPCNVECTGDGSALVWANYTGGSVGAVRLLPNGKFAGKTAEVYTHKGELGPRKDRQEHPHAHCAHLAAGPSGALVSCDLGMDQVLAYSRNAAGAEPPFKTTSKVVAQLAPGSGPRLVVLHPRLPVAYVCTELANTVTVFTWDAPSSEYSGVGDAWREVGTLSTLPSDWDPAAWNCVAHIEISRCGRHVYVSNRGHDSIAAFEANRESGALTVAGHYPSGGATPRHFALSPDERFVLCCNQDSSTVTVLKRDSATGRLDLQGDLTMHVPAPTCIVVARSK